MSSEIERERTRLLTGFKAIHDVCISSFMSMCMYICTCACMYVYVNICVCTQNGDHLG